MKPPLRQPCPQRGRGHKRCLCITCIRNIHLFHLCVAGNTALSQPGDAKAAGALAPKERTTNLILGSLKSKKNYKQTSAWPAVFQYA